MVSSGLKPIVQNIPMPTEHEDIYLLVGKKKRKKREKKDKKFSPEKINNKKRVYVFKSFLQTGFSPSRLGTNANFPSEHPWFSIEMAI